MHLHLEVMAQPDDTTCGPTCLHAVYRYYGESISLDQVISEIAPLPEGGTLAVHLACHALRRGYQAEILTYNLQLFDPTWFAEGVDLAAKLREQRRFKRSVKLGLATAAYLEYLALGGVLNFEELSGDLLRKYLRRNQPLLTGLSATYLYGCSREAEDEYDDIRGAPTGHFVVVSGHDQDRGEVVVADPLQDNPGFGERYYRVSLERLTGAVLLGILTYDANLLVLSPGSQSSAGDSNAEQAGEGPAAAGAVPHAAPASEARAAGEHT